MKTILLLDSFDYLKYASDHMSLRLLTGSEFGAMLSKSHIINEHTATRHHDETDISIKMPSDDLAKKWMQESDYDVILHVDGKDWLLRNLGE